MPASWASSWRTDRCSPAWAAVRRMRWAICRARTQVKTWTLMLCSVQWCIGEKDTTCGSFIWRKENSASDWDRYPAMTSAAGQSSWLVISTCLPQIFGLVPGEVPADDAPDPGFAGDGLDLGLGLVLAAAGLAAGQGGGHLVEF